MQSSLLDLKAIIVNASMKFANINARVFSCLLYSYEIKHFI